MEGEAIRSMGTLLAKLCKNSTFIDGWLNQSLTLVCLLEVHSKFFHAWLSRPLACPDDFKNELQKGIIGFSILCELTLLPSMAH